MLKVKQKFRYSTYFEIDGVKGRNRKKM